MMEPKKGEPSAEETLGQKAPEGEPEADPFAGTKYEGKSAEEIARMHQELESLSGKQSKELGQLRKEKESFEQIYGGQPQGQQYQNPLEQAPQQAQQTQQAPQEPFDDEDYVTGKQAKEYTQQQMFQRDIQMCQLLGQQAKRRFQKDNPELWKEVGQATEQWMNTALYYMQIHPNLYASEEGWENAAHMVWLQRHPETIKERFKEPAPSGQATGTPPVEGEVPVSGKPPTAERTPTTDVPEGIRAMWDKMGSISPEDRERIAKEVKEGRK